MEDEYDFIEAKRGYIAIIQQEGGGVGVQQHAGEINSSKTYCGVPWKQRQFKRGMTGKGTIWSSLGNKLRIEVNRHVTCSRCRKSAVIE